MNYTNSSHPALGALKPEELTAFNGLSPLLQAFFTQQNNLVDGRPEYGAPNDITPAGCLALATLSNQHPDAQGRKCALWNEWRDAFPSRPGPQNQPINIANYQKQRLTSDLCFRGFHFGAHADFRGASVDNGVDFSCAKFEVYANFQGLRAAHGVSFKNVSFGGLAIFSEASFGDGANFSEAKFDGVAYFNFAQFRHCACFDRAHFLDGAAFASAIFAGDVSFSGAWFSYDPRQRHNGGKVCAYFSGAAFGSGVFAVVGAAFDGDADFSARTIEAAVNGFSQGAPHWEFLCKPYAASPSEFHKVNFGDARFRGDVTFAERKFSGSAGFHRTKFCMAPIFHGCTLHPDTSFEGATFPPDQPGFRGEGEAAMRAYRTLKLEFNELHATREEQRFFRYEMIEELKLLSRAVASGPMRSRVAASGRFLLHWLYAFLADWGFSVWRPLVFLVLLPAIAAYVIHLAFAAYAGASLAAISTWASAFEYALLRGLPGFDARAAEIGKVLFTNLGAPERLALTLVDLGLKACLLFGFFLAGLALRNRFKIK